MLFACVLLTDLALDAVLRQRGEVGAFVLVEGPAQLRTVVAANAKARAAGVRPGQRLSAAQALCGVLEVLDARESDAPHWQRFLAAWAYRHSSQVSAQWPGAIVLEVAASFRLFGPWPQFEERLRVELRALGFGHRIAMAPTPRAALVFAGLKDGLSADSPRRLADALRAVPVQAAWLPGDAATRLQQMGLRRLEAVRALPRDGLRRRFGVDLLDHLDRLHGDMADPLELYQPPDHFDARVELGHETVQVQALLFALRRLVNDLATFLSVRDGGVQQFGLQLEHERQGFIGEKTPEATRLEVGLLTTERDPSRLFELARERLERLSISRPVVELRLVAKALPPFVPASRDLFEQRDAQALDWPQLRERLRARLGDTSVYGLEPAPDLRPERAWRRVYEAASGTAATPITRRPKASGPVKHQRVGEGHEAVSSPPMRPTWLLPRPIPLREGIQRILSGPERLETGWWDGGEARRDYYVIETAHGQRAWVFAPVGERQGWMLQGWFA